ncbi:hypothetical protein P4S68_16855 [Pseudoalteromonas sp. Hal099]
MRFAGYGKNSGHSPRKWRYYFKPKQIRFENENLKVQGQITPKTKILNTSVWLHIKGFNKRQWLIISANGVNKQSYARLKRAALIAINGEVESK